MACIGGTPGTCSSVNPGGAGRRVTCALGADYKGAHGATDNHLDIRAGERENCVHDKTLNRQPVGGGVSCSASATDMNTCNSKYERKERGTHRVGQRLDREAGENTITPPAGRNWTAQYGLVGEIHLCEWRAELDRCEAGRVVTVCPEEHVAEAEVHTNMFYRNVQGVGGHGGSCTCPDGQVYQVGDNNDFCGSLACIGGTPGTCNAHTGEWSNNKVICGRAPNAGTAGPCTDQPASCAGDTNGVKIGAIDGSVCAFSPGTHTLSTSNWNSGFNTIAEVTDHEPQLENLCDGWSGRKTIAYIRTGPTCVVGFAEAGSVEDTCLQPGWRGTMSAIDATAGSLSCQDWGCNNMCMQLPENQYLNTRAQFLAQQSSPPSNYVAYKNRAGVVISCGNR